MDAVSAVLAQRARDTERLTPIVGWSMVVHVALKRAGAAVGSRRGEPLQACRPGVAVARADGKFAQAFSAPVGTPDTRRRWDG